MSEIVEQNPDKLVFANPRPLAKLLRVQVIQGAILTAIVGSAIYLFSSTQLMPKTGQSPACDRPVARAIECQTREATDSFIPWLLTGISAALVILLWVIIPILMMKTQVWTFDSTLKRLQFRYQSLFENNEEEYSFQEICKLQIRTYVDSDDDKWPVAELVLNSGKTLPFISKPFAYNIHDAKSNYLALAKLRDWSDVYHFQVEERKVEDYQEL
ncbi:MAG: hypothetical protein SFW36_02790 [Leptolyngbyaceae cyanobacterium bins.59]|nr:hypothetical protein [Leptolyngbyaceae cyanobacterium bins.59]